MVSDSELLEDFAARWTKLRSAVETRIARSEARRNKMEANRVLPVGVAIEANVLRDIIRMMNSLDEAASAGTLHAVAR